MEARINNILQQQIIRYPKTNRRHLNHAVFVVILLLLRSVRCYQVSTGGIVMLIYVHAIDLCNLLVFLLLKLLTDPMKSIMPDSGAG